MRDPDALDVARALLCCTAMAICFTAGSSSAQVLGCKLTARPGPPAIEVLTCDGLTIEAETAADVKVSNAAGGPSPDSARVQGGGALVSVTPGRKTPFQILTPRAIASVRGTRYAVDDAPGQTSIFVERGIVQVTRASGGSAVTLRAGDGVDVRESADALSVQRWSRARGEGPDGAVRSLRRRVKPIPPRAWAFAAVGIASLAWACLLAMGHLEGRPTPLDRLEYLSLDGRALLFGPRPAPPDVAIVAIDDETVEAAGQYPLPRAMLARLVDAIAADGARVVALDMLFTSATTSEADTALADALGRTRAITAAAATFGQDDTATGPDHALSRLPSAQRVMEPIEPIRSSAGAGLVNVSTDEGGTPRFVPTLVRIGTSVVPALTLAAASLATGEPPSFEPDAVLFGAARIPLDLGRHLALRFYGPRGSVPTLSASDILRGQGLAGRLHGKAVVVGVTATGAGDVFATPFDPVLPGVEVTATALAELLGAGALVRTSSVRRVDAGIAVGLTIALVLLLGLSRVGLGLGAAAILVAAWLGIVVWVFAHGYWLSVSVPLAAALPAGGAAFLTRFYLDRRASAATFRSALALRPFQQPALAERLVCDPDFLLRPEERQVAIVFIDLSGFTGLSEAVGPQRARDLLETFHKLVEESATAHGAVVASYQGDGAMILFGLLETREDDAARALAMSLSLRDATKLWLRDLAGDLGPLDVKLGAHLGRVSLSRLGHRTHQHITAIGDAVNVASRLMGVAAQHGSTLAASCELLRDAAAFGSAHVDGFGPLLSAAIRGRSQPIDVRLSS